MLRTAEKAASENGAKRILKITLSLGIYSGIVPDYVISCFEEVSAGTIAEGAELIFHELPVRIRCRECGRESEVDTSTFRCPACGGEDYQLTGGREFYIESLEAD